MGLSCHTLWCEYKEQIPAQMTGKVPSYVVLEYTVRASIFSRTEFLAYRTEPCYTGLPKVQFDTVRYANQSMCVLKKS